MGRTAPRARRQTQGRPESWASSLGSLLSSQLGREILADVLDAASAVLRRDRGGQQIAGAVNAVAGAGADVASTAVEVGTDVVSGAVDASATIASAVADMAETAAGTLASLATGTVLDRVSGAAADEGSTRGKKGSGRRGAGTRGTGEDTAS